MHAYIHIVYMYMRIYMHTRIYTSTYKLEYTHSHIDTCMYACMDVRREEDVGREEDACADVGREGGEGGTDKEWMKGEKGGGERERGREGERREASQQRKGGGCMYGGRETRSQSTKRPSE